MQKITVRVLKLAFIYAQTVRKIDGGVGVWIGQVVVDGWMITQNLPVFCTHLDKINKKSG